MNNPITDFMDKAKGLTKNPLGIIALFVSLIYGVASFVLSTSIDNLHGQEERLPMIWFIILFPILILIAFTFLVIYHHKKLYGPSDFKDEKNFVNTFTGNKEVPSDLDRLLKKLRPLATELNGDKLNDTIKEIERIKEKSEQIPINNMWRLNHWGSNCASIQNNKIIFTGTSAPNHTDGAHIDINELLEIGKTYEVSCFAKSSPGTTGKFQLWCHDQTGSAPNGVSITTAYNTPSTTGERIKLTFQAQVNKNIRIHLQYMPGQGQIELSDVKITELAT